MLSRLILFALTLFWVTMNVLLWRSEFGQDGNGGSSMPAGIVWEKILTAPDNSALEISHHGQKVGYGRWAAVVGQNPAAQTTGAEAPPDGMVARPADYRIEFEGNAELPESGTRLRFDMGARFSSNHVWQQFKLRLNLRPESFEIEAIAGEQAIHVRTGDGTGNSEQVIKFADLENPAGLARILGVPLPPGALGLLKPGAGDGQPPQLSAGLKWEARNDWFSIGHASVRAYRLEAKLLDRYRVVVMVSRVGEILQVELPDDWVLMNDGLTLF